MKSFSKVLLIFLLSASFLAGCIGAAQVDKVVQTAPDDPPEVAVGERLFLETRFAQFFAAKNPNAINEALQLGDPVMDLTLGVHDSLPGPFAGQSMNCRACHLVDEQLNAPNGGMRTYDDFAQRSPIPDRGDGRTQTPRNSPSLVNSMIAPPESLFLHFDGEFPTIEDLVRGTFTGRNFGWLPTEKDQAIHHLAQVIREDDGSGVLASDYDNLPYRTLLKGTDENISDEFRLPEEFRIDVDTASDQQILDAVAKLVGAYTRNLLFVKDAAGEYSTSPYDVFLRKNNLPRKPDAGESDLAYARRLRDLVNVLSNPVFVGAADGTFQFHTQDFVFGEKELAGLKIFLAESESLPLTPEQVDQGGTGNCLACHTPPNFIDFKFHNVGTAQDEFDQIHGAGTFSALFVPDFFTRNADPDQYLPPNADHPDALGPFLRVPSADQTAYTDLGLWNVFGNPAVPGPQDRLQKLICDMFGASAGSCDPETLLPFTIGLFKTPSLRDLGHSAPYFHTGQKESLEEVLNHYIKFSEAARNAAMLNPAPELSAIALRSNDIDPLVAFLKALNEDYN